MIISRCVCIGIVMSSIGSKVWHVLAGVIVSINWKTKLHACVGSIWWDSCAYRSAMKLIGCGCVYEGPPEVWKDLRLECPGAWLLGCKWEAKEEISKLQKFAGNWSGDDEDIRKLGLSITESKSNKGKHNTVVQRNVIPKWVEHDMVVRSKLQMCDCHDHQPVNLTLISWCITTTAIHHICCLAQDVYFLGSDPCHWPPNSCCEQECFLC